MSIDIEYEIIWKSSSSAVTNESTYKKKESSFFFFLLRQKLHGKLSITPSVQYFSNTSA